MQLLHGVRADEAVANMLVPLHLSVASPGGDRGLVAVKESIEEKPESMTYSNLVRRLVAPSGRVVVEEKERAATRGTSLLAVMGGHATIGC